MKIQKTAPLKRTYWLESAVPGLKPTNQLKGVQIFDVAIVGGGFVGLWTALNLKRLEPDLRVAVIEQDVCGGGASGRNGGFAMSWWPKISSLMSFCSREQALFLADAAEKAIYELGEFCSTHQIDAHFVQSGWLWTATSQAHIDTWNSTLAACEKLGVRPFERVSPQELANRTGSPVHLAGVWEESNATVQPAALSRGLHRVALEAGVQIFENSGVTDIEPGDIVTISTIEGEIKANQVVLANNAWAASIPELGKLIVPVNSSIAVTAPVPERLKSMGWGGGESITDSQLMVDYYRTTRDGRIAFGKGTGAIAYGGAINQVFSADERSIELTVSDLRRTYPMLNDVEITHSWSGPIDRTYDSLPVFGSLQDSSNIHFGIGWSGNGVSPSQLGGRILASMALNRKDQWSACALVGRKCRTFPPEPFRYIGGSMVRNAVIRKESAEMDGRPVSGIDRLLAKLAPAGLEDKS